MVILDVLLVPETGRTGLQVPHRLIAEFFVTAFWHLVVGEHHLVSGQQAF